MTCSCQSCHHSEPRSEESEEESEQETIDESEEEQESDGHQDESDGEQDACESHQPGKAGYDDSVSRCRDDDGRFISCVNVGC